MLAESFWVTKIIYKEKFHLGIIWNCYEGKISYKNEEIKKIKLYFRTSLLGSYWDCEDNA